MMKEKENDGKITEYEIHKQKREREKVDRSVCTNIVLYVGPIHYKQ